MVLTSVTSGVLLVMGWLAGLAEPRLLVAAVVAAAMGQLGEELCGDVSRGGGRKRWPGRARPWKRAWRSGTAC